MLVGYMRVSSEGDRQTTALQQDALLAAGVDERFFRTRPAVPEMIDRALPLHSSLFFRVTV